MTKPLYLGTGSTLLNLACSDNPFGGFQTGKYYSLVGDSDSGKTWLSQSCYAEAAIDSKFDDYRFIHDNPEDGAGMDIAHYFGQAVADRIEQPSDNGPSEFLDDFYYNVADALQDKDKRPFIYVLDSIDVLDAKSDDKLFEKRKTTSRKRTKQQAEGETVDADTAGSYGMARAKMNSSNLRKVRGMLARDGRSVLIIINQSREMVGGAMFGPRKTRAGGKALKFYSTIEMWSSVAKTLKKEVLEEKVQTGIICKIKMTKNHLTGKQRTIEFPIFHSYGIDDTGSCIDYLVAHKYWKKSKSTIDAADFDLKMTRMKLANEIEERQLTRQLRSLVGDIWAKIEKACVLPRARRYE